MSRASAAARIWLLEEVRGRRLGHGKAAELAGVPLADFLGLMGEHRITPFDFDDDELARELGAGPRPKKEARDIRHAP
jgi:predicted HTH domain antitoxin